MTGIWSPAGEEPSIRIGVIDVGSTSARLQVVDAAAGAPPLPAHTYKHPTLLGREIRSDGSLSQEGLDRVVDAVCATVAMAQELRVRELFCYATSAVRDATNRDDVVAAIQKCTGLRPQFLTGQQEAWLTYHAAHRWYGWSAGRLLLLDIGGGTSEIVLGRDIRPEVTLSLPLGAGRLTRAFLPDDPPRRADLKRLRRHVRKSLRDVTDRVRWDGDFSRAVATSKTLLQLARLAGAAPRRAGPFARRALSTDDLDRWIPKLARMSAERRAALRGISSARAPFILAGAVVAREAMAALSVVELEVCPWALREGIILHYLENEFEREQLPLEPLRLPVVVDGVERPIRIVR